MTILKGGVDGFIYFSLISVILFSNQDHPCHNQKIKRSNDLKDFGSEVKPKGPNMLTQIGMVSYACGRLTLVYYII